MRAVIVGAGLFGQLIARGLASVGHDVVLVDNREPNAGSPPAACLIRREWCGKLPEGVYEMGMSFLRHHFTIERRELIKFGPKPGKVVADWVNPRAMMSYRTVYAKAHPIEKMEHRRWCWGVRLAMINDDIIKHDIIGCDLVVVAAGVWSQELVPQVDLQLKGKAGAAWLLKDLKQPGFIAPWAPYRQIVGFDRGDGYWVSDGSALDPKTYGEGSERLRASEYRCFAGTMAEGVPKEQLWGIRPYTQELPCFCKEVEPGLWVAVGARKNGTLLGAWCAERISNEVGNAS